MKRLRLGVWWRRLARFFERGDLVPFYVVVSIGHYIPVLEAHDGRFIAALVGVAVDMLHFRAVRAWFDGKIISFNMVIGVLTTAMATGYHLRFYENDWLLALPIPVGIAILAYQMSESESRLSRRANDKQERDNIQKELNDLNAKNDATLREFDKVRDERHRLEKEVVKLRRAAAKEAVPIDKLPQRLAEYVLLVADGVTPDGDYSDKHDIGATTLTRANSMFLRG